MSLPTLLTTPFKKLLETPRNAPWTSFFIFLILLFGAIFLGHTLRAPEPAPEREAVSGKQVSILIPKNASPTLDVSAEIKKGSTVKIIALTPGVITNVLVRPGQSVLAGTTLFSLSNDYQSGSAELEKQIALNDARLAEEVARLDKDIQKLEERRAKRDTSLTNTEEDIALENLEKDREIRRTTLANSKLNLALALRNDAVLRPKSGFSGVVTHIAVRPGQFVNAGDTLATITARGETATAEVSLSLETASLLDSQKPATITVNHKDYTLTPLYISSQENDSGLYTALFSLPEEVSGKLINNRYSTLSLTLKNTPDGLILPLEAVSQDNNQAWVMTEDEGVARAKAVTLGNVFGNYVEVREGITPDTHIILSRGLIEGEKVTVE